MKSNMRKKLITGGLVVVGVIVFAVGYGVMAKKASLGKTAPTSDTAPRVAVGQPVSDKEASVPRPNPNGTEAKVTLDDSEVSLKANALGAFPVTTVKPNRPISVHLTLTPNTAVQQTALDGGQFANKSNLQSQTADSTGALHFQYQTASIPGNYRIALNYQGQQLLFNFWVGPPLTPRVSAQK